jgi:hypothetical protein
MVASGRRSAGDYRLLRQPARDKPVIRLWLRAAIGGTTANER